MLHGKKIHVPVCPLIVSRLNATKIIQNISYLHCVYLATYNVYEQDINSNITLLFIMADKSKKTYI
jgi:hypothetical protein